MQRSSSLRPNFSQLKSIVLQDELNYFEDSSLNSYFQGWPIVHTESVWIDFPFEQKVLSHLNVSRSTGSVQAIEASWTYHV